MRLLSLDYDPVYDDATRATFAGDLSVFDFDVVIWDPAQSLKAYMSDYGQRWYQGRPSLSEHQSVRIRADAERRKAEFSEFVGMGRVLVVIARPPQRCYVDTGKREFSGTGRNQKVTHMVSDFDLLSAMPGEKIEYAKAGGSRIGVEGDGPLERLLIGYKDFIRYTAVMLEPPGTVLARVTGTNRSVALVRSEGGGGFTVLLPSFDFSTDSSDDAEETEEMEEDDEDLESWHPKAFNFQQDLISSIEGLTRSEGKVWPSWADEYLTSGQRECRAEIAKQQRRVESARTKLSQLQRRAEDLEARNQLFLGSGRSLELEVKRVLELLGGNVTEPDPGRADWRVSFPEADAVVEVKGVSKSAAEKQSAQLEKWVSAAFEESGVAPKGILIVNTWRELPISERLDADFPKQMLPYSEARGHCLATGIQLLVIQDQIERDPKKAEFWRQEILRTNGVLAVSEDWRSVIEYQAIRKSGDR